MLSKYRSLESIVAYFTQDTLDYLGIVDDFPALSSLEVPPGLYKSARSSKTRREPDSPYEHFAAPVSQCYPPNKMQAGLCFKVLIFCV